MTANTSSQKYASIARPYALAAFEYARDNNQLPTWKTLLANATAIVEQPEVNQLLANPEISAEKWLALFSDILSADLNTESKNFLHLLSQNKRLIILPEIAALFNNHYAAFVKITTVRVVTAVENTDEYRQTLIQAVSKRVHHNITLISEVDPSIIGG